MAIVKKKEINKTVEINSYTAQVKHNKYKINNNKSTSKTEEYIIKI